MITKEKISSKKAGAIWNALGSVMAGANSVLLLMIVSNIADIDTVGAFSLAITTAQILYVVGIFGVNDYQMTDYHDKYDFSDYFWAKLFSTVIACCCCCGIVIFLFGFTGNKLLFTLLLVGFMQINSIAEVFQCLFFQHERLDMSGKSLFFRYLISTMAFIGCSLITKNIAAAALLMLLVNGIISWWWSRKKKLFVSPGCPFHGAACKELMLSNFPLCISMIGSLIVINCPRYIIELIASDGIQGLYAVLFMPVSAISLIGSFIFKPYISLYSKVINTGNKGAFLRLFFKQAAVILGITLACAVIIWFIGVPILNLLFGLELSAHRLLLVLFMISGGMLALNQLLYYIMVILRKQRLVFCVYFCGVAAAILLGIPLIEKFMVVGAWISFTVAQVVLLLGFILFVWLSFDRGDSSALIRKDNNGNSLYDR